jgi:hydroxypyruvate isomerase
MTISACCTDFVPLTVPDERNRYLERLQETLAAADRLGISTIISQVGQEQSGAGREKQRDSIIAGLTEAARVLEGSGKRMVIEPLNTKYDHPGYFLSASSEARQILEAVGTRHVGLLFDIYHQQVTEGDVINNLRASLDWIWHIHIADSPGRHEIGTGELNYPNILANLEDWGYGGYVGVELFPVSPDHTQALTGSIFDL